MVILDIVVIQEVVIRLKILKRSSMDRGLFGDFLWAAKVRERAYMRRWSYKSRLHATDLKEVF